MVYIINIFLTKKMYYVLFLYIQNRDVNLLNVLKYY